MELIYWQHIVTSEYGDAILRTDETFKGQIVSAIKGCSLYSYSYPEIFYDQRSLTKIALDYNTCGGKDLTKIYSLPIEKWKAKTELMFGDRNGVQQKSNSFYCGFAVCAIAPGLNRRLSWRNELGLNFHSTNIFPKVSSLAEYDLSLTRVKPFVDLGISLAFSKYAGSGILTGLGVKSNHFSIEVRHELDNGVNGLFTPKKERNDSFFFLGRIRF